MPRTNGGGILLSIYIVYITKTYSARKKRCCANKPKYFVQEVLRSIIAAHLLPQALLPNAAYSPALGDGIK